MGEFAIGQGVPRFEDPRLIKGGGRYIDDMTFPGMAHGVVLRSPHAHARIRSIDTAKAKAAPGVLAVLTARRLTRPRASATCRCRAASSAATARRSTGRAIRCWSKTACAGSATTSPSWSPKPYCQAVDAAELIEVDYEPLPAVVSTAEAAESGRAAGLGRLPDNIGFVQLEGDKAATDAAFARAAHVVKHRFVINRVTAATMEPRGAVGVYRAGRRPLHDLHDVAAHHVFQTELSQYVLKVPESKIRVICGDIGGSFGMKSPVFNEAPLVLLGAKLTGRPVKWMSTRSEAFLATRRRATTSPRPSSRSTRTALSSASG